MTPTNLYRRTVGETFQRKNDMLRAAVVAASILTAHATSADEDNGGNRRIEEVVVTAQKRSESIQDVPVAVTALSGNTLEDRAQYSLKDYFRDVPGLSLNTSGNGQTNISIRGVTTGVRTNPTVGITIDDIPYGSSVAVGYGDVLVPDLDPADIQRVEVLKGPQGTLYGASSMGGLLKFVTTDPSLEETSARLQVDANTVSHGDTGFGIRGQFSAPIIEDELAIRLSGFSRRDAGFVDNVANAEKDVNSVDVSGGRAGVLWLPNDMLSVRLGALAQDTEGDSTSAINADSTLEPVYGELEHNRLPGFDSYETKVRLYNINASLDLDEVSITSLTAFGKNQYKGDMDVTVAFQRLAENFHDLPHAVISNSFKTDKVSQELRFASVGNQAFDWLIGAFYTNESTKARQVISAADSVGTTLYGPLIDIAFPTEFEEYAVFGTLTVPVNDRFDIQVGARYSENEQEYRETDRGDIYPVPAHVQGRSEDESVTYLLTPRFHPSEDLMLYARIATGYRAGGPNPGAALGYPDSFDPDTTTNYEIGAKGKYLGGLLSFDAAIYHIDWEDIQIRQVDPETSFTYFSNATEAESQGAEVSLQAYPIEGMSVSLTTGWTDAELTAALPPGSYGQPGDQLPYSARFTSGFAIDQDFDIGRNLRGSVGVSGNYQGKRHGSFVGSMTDVRTEIPSYFTIDLRAGIVADSWNLTLFAKNVNDKRGLLSGDPVRRASATDPYTYTVVQPRTLGVTFAKNF